MRLSIIIPTYNTDTTDLLCLLFSIRSQTSMAWSHVEVIIVNDGGTQIPEELFTSLAPMQILVINLEFNVGPGVARQVGIDTAQGDYLLFCDADDTLYSVASLSLMLQEAITNNEPDIIVAKWYEEIIPDNGEATYIVHNLDWTWMHGKMIRAEFLREHNIRHDPSLRIHEDSYFLNLFAAYGPRIVETDVICYIWRWHSTSITRRGRQEYAYTSIPDFLHAVGLADAKIEQFNPELMPERIAYRICYIFHLTHSDEVTNHPDAQKTAEKAFIKEITPYLHYWNDVSEGIIRDIYAQTIQYAHGAIVDESLYEWLARLQINNSNMVKCA